jgi:hypothetical protein
LSFTLSRYFKGQTIELLSRVSPPIMMNSLEVMAYAPPFCVLPHISGIQSPTESNRGLVDLSVGGDTQNHAPQPEFTSPPARRR